MKHLSQKTGKNGKTVVTIELDAGESLVGINPRNYYELGEPLRGDILSGWVLENIQEVSWCSIEQKWVR